MNSLRIVGGRMLFKFVMSVAKLTFVVSLSAAIGAMVFLWFCISEQECPGQEEEEIIFCELYVGEKS